MNIENSIHYKGLDFSKLIDDEVLFFIRIRGKASYFKATYPKCMLASFKKLSQFRTISEYKKDADVYIDLKKYSPLGLETYEEEVISACIDELNIIRRCRALRRIDYLESRNLIISCSRFFINLYRNSKLKLIVSEVNDNYVMDIMTRIASHFGVVVFGSTASFLGPKYKIVTVNGEYNYFRDPSQEEVNLILHQLRERSKSAFAISRFQGIKKSIYNVMSYHYRMFVRHWIGYKILKNIEYEYRFTPYMHLFKSIDQILATRYLSGASALEEINNNEAIYIPLHFYPEGSYDYWVKDSVDSNYIVSLAKVLKFYTDKGIKVIIKEHPAFYLNRTSSFYRSLLSFPGVKILSPFVTTKEVCNKLKKFVVWCGSSGVEALVQGMDVKIVTENYYSHNRLKFYNEEGESRLSKDEDVELIRKVLSCTYLIKG